MAIIEVALHLILGQVVRLTHSAGFMVLDKASMDAITPAKFTPKEQNGLAVEESTDIVIYW